MKKLIFISSLIVTTFNALAQNNMTPELLWKLGRVSAVGITKDDSGVVYALSILMERKFISMHLRMERFSCLK
jgi:hypothetical protein